MIIVILYFAVFLILWLRYRKKAKGSVGALLLLFYLMSAFMSLTIGLIDSFEKEAELDWISTIYYVACVLISLFPFLYMGKLNSKDFFFPRNLLKYTSYFIIFFGLLEVVISFTELYSNRAMIVSNIAGLRDGFYDSLGDTSNNTILQKMRIFVRPFQYMAPFLSLYCISRGDKKLAIWTAVASICIPLHGMTVGERESILVFFSNWAFCYLFFKGEISELSKTRIKRIGSTAMLPFVIFFFAMSFARFGDLSNGSFNSFLSYGGKQPYFFSYLFNDSSIESQKLGGRFCFQYLFPESERAWRQLNEYISADEYLNQFGGLPGSFFLDFGYLSILIVAAIAIVFFLIIKRTKRIGGKFPFYLLFIFYFSFQVLFMNIFYLDYIFLPQIFLSSLFFFICLFFSNYRSIRTQLSHY